MMGFTARQMLRMTIMKRQMKLVFQKHSDQILPPTFSQNSVMVLYKFAFLLIGIHIINKLCFLQYSVKKTHNNSVK